MKDLNAATLLAAAVFALPFCTPSLGLAQMITAHRGASFDAPENTLAAFQEAWQQGADAIEGDFYFTADQHIVCIHDKDTKRTAAKKIDVAQSTLAELRQLEYGGWKSDKFRGEPIPTFPEVLQCVPLDKTFVIELKTGPEIVRLLERDIAAHAGELPNLLIISFDEKTIAEAKKRLPEVRAHWLTSYKRHPITQTASPSAKTIAETLRRCKADGLGTNGDRSVVTKEFVSELKQLGIGEFHVWTIDEPEDAKFFREIGCVGITTNRPAFIRQQIER